MQMGSRKRGSRAGWRRRLLVAISLAAYLTTTIGVPMPATASKEHGRPFPCQDHACGCATAGECWDHCCCYTAEEKLAWAHEHHVKPPAQLVTEVAAAALCATAEPAAPKSACCAKHEAHAAHAAGDHDVAAGDHDHGAGDQDHFGPSCAQHDRSDVGVTFVLGFMARKCRGQADAWCLTGAVTPPPALVAWQFRWDVVEWLTLDTRLCLSGDLAPPVPPPRV